MLHFACEREKSARLTNLIPKTLFYLSAQCADNQILAEPSKDIDFRTACWLRKNKTSTILCGTRISRDCSQTGNFAQHARRHCMRRNLGLPRSQFAQSLKNLFDRLRQCLGNSGCRRHGVIAQDIECSIHCCPPVHSHWTHSGDLAPRTLTNWTPMKPVPIWPALTTTAGFEVQERPRCKHCK